MDLKFSVILRRYKIHPVSSSDAKVMTILRKLLESGFYVDKRCGFLDGGG
jgi:hypothetical protein